MCLKSAAKIGKTSTYQLVNFGSVKQKTDRLSKTDFTELKHLLSTPKNIAIVAHKSPDGDAIGSSLGLYHYLNKKGHNVSVIAPNDYPHFLKWMPGNDTVLKYDSQTEESQNLINNAEVIFTLDFNAFHRTGDMENVLEKSKGIKIMIDHHQQPDDYATYMYSDVSMSSTCEMVYNFITMLGDKNVTKKGTYFMLSTWRYSTLTKAF